jgi:uncharacterized membrane protein YhaH (DUF805 family)
MTFRQAILTCLRKYFIFSGRATRPEYWWFFLFCILGSFAFEFLDELLFEPIGHEIDTIASHSDANGPLSSVFNIATFIPTLAAGWRRMHDTGRSGLYLLYPIFAMLGIVTFISFALGFEELVSGNIEALLTGGFGIILVIALIVLALSPLIVLYWLTRPTQQGDNFYGPDPRKVFP